MKHRVFVFHNSFMTDKTPIHDCEYKHRGIETQVSHKSKIDLTVTTWHPVGRKVWSQEYILQDRHPVAHIRTNTEFDEDIDKGNAQELKKYREISKNKYTYKYKIMNHTCRFDLFDGTPL